MKDCIFYHLTYCPWRRAVEREEYERLKDRV